MIDVSVFFNVTVNGVSAATARHCTLKPAAEGDSIDRSVEVPWGSQPGPAGDDEALPLGTGTGEYARGGIVLVGSDTARSPSTLAYHATTTRRPSGVAASAGI